VNVGCDNHAISLATKNYVRLPNPMSASEEPFIITTHVIPSVASKE